MAVADIVNVLTNKGLALITKSLANTFAVKFTKAELGTGIAEDAATLATRTSLIKRFASASITKKSVGEGGTFVVSLQYWNTGVKETTYIYEIGIFANDPDEGDILFSYLTFGAQPDLILAENKASVQRVYDVPFLFGGKDGNVTVKITPSTLLAATEAVNTPQANKLLRLDENGKLPCDITGDAATLGGVAPEGYSLSDHVHAAATQKADGFLSAADKTALDTLGKKVGQSLTMGDSPTFAGLTVNGIIDGAQFR